MRSARLDDSGRSEPLAVVGRWRSVGDMKLEAENRNSLDLIRLPANL